MDDIERDSRANQGGRGRGTGRTRRRLSGSELSAEEQVFKPSWWQKLSGDEKVGLTIFVSILFELLAIALAVLVAHYVFYASMLALAAALGVSGVGLPLFLVGLVAALIAFEIPCLWNMKIVGAIYEQTVQDTRKFLWSMGMIALLGGAGLGLLMTAATPALLSFLAASLGVGGAYVVMAIVTALFWIAVVGLLGSLAFNRGRLEGSKYLKAWYGLPNDGLPLRDSKLAQAEQKSEGLPKSPATEVVHESPIGGGGRSKARDKEAGIDVGEGWKFYQPSPGGGSLFAELVGELKKEGQPTWKVYKYQDGNLGYQKGEESATPWAPNEIQERVAKVVREISIKPSPGPNLSSE